MRNVLEKCVLHVSNDNGQCNWCGVAVSLHFNCHWWLVCSIELAQCFFFIFIYYYGIMATERKLGTRPSHLNDDIKTRLTKRRQSSVSVDIVFRLWIDYGVRIAVSFFIVFIALRIQRAKKWDAFASNSIAKIDESIMNVTVETIDWCEGTTQLIASNWHRVIIRSNW